MRSIASGWAPGPTPPDLTPYLTANLTLTNASEDIVDVVVAIVDTDTGTRTDVIGIALGPSGLKAQKLPDATYYATFTRRATGAQSACAFHVFKGDQVGFTALAEHILITSTSFSPSTGADLDITTSFACQARLS